MAVLPVGAQIAGNTTSTLAEVELNTLAMRNVVRPFDFSFRGSFGIQPGAQVGLWSPAASAGNLGGQVWLRILAGTGSGNPPWSTIFLLKRLDVEFVNTVAFNAAGALRINGFFSRASGGPSGSATGAELRTGMIGPFTATVMSNIQVGGTVTIPAGADAQPFCSATWAIPATTIRQNFTATLFDFRAGEHPVLLSPRWPDSIFFDATSFSTTSLFSSTTSCDVMIQLWVDEYDSENTYGALNLQANLAS